MMRIYIAGPMRDYPRNNFPAFDVVAKALRDVCHHVFSPAERDRKMYGEEVEFMTQEQAKTVGFDIRAALKADLSWICDHAEGLAMLPGWEMSTGARAEWALAVALGLDIRYIGASYVP
jgi:nucleoside 2-deoxyribosyltransferase